MFTVHAVRCDACCEPFRAVGGERVDSEAIGNGVTHGIACELKAAVCVGASLQAGAMVRVPEVNQFTQLACVALLRLLRLAP